MIEQDQQAGALASLIQGHDALISAFNPGWKNPNLYDEHVRGTSSIIEAVKKAGTLKGEVEIDEVYVVAGHKGQPAAVAQRGGLAGAAD